jgi:hypothetical protein
MGMISIKDCRGLPEELVQQHYSHLCDPEIQLVFGALKSDE